MVYNFNHFNVTTRAVNKDHNNAIIMSDDSYINNNTIYSLIDFDVNNSVSSRCDMPAPCRLCQLCQCVIMSCVPPSPSSSPPPTTITTFPASRVTPAEVYNRYLCHDDSFLGARPKPIQPTRSIQARLFVSWSTKEEFSPCQEMAHWVWIIWFLLFWN